MSPFPAPSSCPCIRISFRYGIFHPGPPGEEVRAKERIFWKRIPGRGRLDGADFRAGGRSGNNRFSRLRAVGGRENRNGSDNRFLPFMGLIGALQGKIPLFSRSQGIIRLFGSSGFLRQRFHAPLQLCGGIQFACHPFRIPGLPYNPPPSPAVPRASGKGWLRKKCLRDCQRPL